MARPIGFDFDLIVVNRYRVLAAAVRSLGDSLVERKHPSRVVDKNQSYNLFTHSAYPHSGDDSSEDVIESVAAISFEAVLRTDVVGKQNTALLAFGNHVFDHLDSFVVGWHV